MSEAELIQLRDETSEALSERPAEIRLLMLRLSIHTLLEDSRGMRRDATLLAELQPGVPEAQMYKCLQDEAATGKTDEVLRCYRSVAGLYGGPDKERNPEYILAALFAELPEAEGLRRDYIEQEAQSPQTDMYKELLRDFSRHMFVPGRGMDLTKQPDEAGPTNRRSHAP
ncbi:hypothetical protein LJB82_01460 [Desulfovibrio sp. OttesenSCG-928-M16]|nr:hypothetical protein [Desulfovibrio sp. OttesenSCG-928-M16]